MGNSHIYIILLLFLSFTSLTVSERCHPNDKKALLQIKKDLNNPYNITTWKPQTDCCSGWSGVECHKKTNRVIKFDISESDLKLPIPAAVGDLPYLQSLTFHLTNATGEIPVAISKLSNLKFLDLSWNLLTGPVPSFLGNLKKLTFLRLSYNKLTGSIPASLSQLPELGGLFLERNKLTGSIPEWFADSKQPDFYVYMSDNQLSGPIPRKLGSANFSWFDVSRNRLEGDISFMFGKNKSLSTGYFSRNLFEFDLTHVEFSQQLLNLDLSHNKIYGSLPRDLSSTGVISLDVSYNRLCGPIPELRMFQTFDASVFMHNKCLCGKPLPKCK